MPRQRRAGSAKVPVRVLVVGVEMRAFLRSRNDKRSDATEHVANIITGIHLTWGNSHSLPTRTGRGGAQHNMDAPNALFDRAPYPAASSSTPASEVEQVVCARAQARQFRDSVAAAPSLPRLPPKNRSESGTCAV